LINEHLDIVKLLIKHGADIHNGRDDASKILIKNDVNIYDLKDYLCIIKKNNSDMYELILENSYGIYTNCEESIDWHCDFSNILKFSTHRKSYYWKRFNVITI